MNTEVKKRREAFKFNANLSDRDIRQIRATAQGMTTYQYESFLKEIGIDLSNKVMSLKASNRHKKSRTVLSPNGYG